MAELREIAMPLRTSAVRVAADIHFTDFSDQRATAAGRTATVGYGHDRIDEDCTFVCSANSSASLTSIDPEVPDGGLPFRLPKEQLDRPAGS